jgi:hypothetical protein
MRDPVGRLKIVGRLSVTLLIVVILVLAVQDFYGVAKGTQNWIGKFSLTWGTALAGLTFLGLLTLIYGMLNLWAVRRISVLNDGVARVRDRLGWFSWLIIFVISFIPAKIFLYTPLGEKLTGIGFRLAIFITVSAILAVLATREQGKLVSLDGVLVSLVVLGSVFLMSKAFVGVVDHPLSLTWSEGNRIWDYSILYGRDLYNYPQDQPIEAYIDKARQTLWGLPFLIPQVTIKGIRLWSTVVFTLPYAILGWMSFRSMAEHRRQWFWLGVWALLFLNQGPIYTPLILSAILVVGARRKPLWIALPLIYMAGYYAQGSRITWMIAPAMWAVVIAMMDMGELRAGKRWISTWGKIGLYGLAGFLGGFGIIRGWMRLYNYITRAAASNTEVINAPRPEVTFISPDDAVEAVSAIGQNSALTNQALLWERLFPNPTYGLGILLGLLLAVGPLIILLVFLVRSKRWKLNFWKQFWIVGILLTLMGLGIFISTKIGGGGDLHNLDMFFVGLLFVGVFAWESGGHEIFANLDNQPIGIKVTILLAAVIPAFMPWVNAVPLELPPDDKTAWTLELLQYETDRVQAEGGEILFMDQRQLLTFGYLGDIPLVPEYEKKLVMDKAMSGDSDYFEQFYRDISAHRFALIVSEPQRVRFSEEDEGWGVENDTWVEWVTKPLLCYYEPVYTIKKTGVWFLRPIDEPVECPYP